MPFKKGKNKATNKTASTQQPGDEAVQPPSTTVTKEVATDAALTSSSFDLIGKEVATLRLRAQPVNGRPVNGMPGRVTGFSEDTGRFIVDTLVFGTDGHPLFDSEDAKRSALGRINEKTALRLTDLLNTRGVRLVRKLIKRENLCLLSYEHGPQLLEIYEKLIESFSRQVNWPQLSERLADHKLGKRDDFQRIESILDLAMKHRHAGSKAVTGAAWRALEQTLPLMRLVLGPHSVHEAAALMLQVNVWEELDARVTIASWRKAEAYAQELLSLCAASPPIAAGARLDPPLPFWPDESRYFEGGGPGVDRAYLEADALSHLGSALQFAGQNEKALRCYEEALAKAEVGGHEGLVRGTLNNLATMHEALAAPAMSEQIAELALRGESGGRQPQKLKKKPTLRKNPLVFDAGQTAHLNAALRYALRFLAIAQRSLGTTHESTGRAHQILAQVCWTCRHRKPGLYHAERALRIMTATFSQFSDRGAAHPAVASARDQLDMFQAYPTAQPVTLATDVAEGLSRGGATQLAGARCDNPDCEEREEAAGEAGSPPKAAGSPAGARGKPKKFMTCSRCRAARYCSAACHKAHWPTHKPACASAAKVSDEQTSSDYKAKQKEIKELLKRESKEQGWEKGRPGSGES